MSRLEVESVAKVLTTATQFQAVFGPLPAGDAKAKRGAVRKQFAYLAQTVHPDHAPECPDLAEKTFEHLRALFTAAEEAILAGKYDEKFPAGHKPSSKTIDNYFELKSKTATYRCDNTPYRSGDFSVLYRAQVDKLAEPSAGSAGAKQRDVLVKISNDPTSNPLLETEAMRLKMFRSTDALKGLSRFLPELVDTFVIPGPDRKQFRANVTDYNPGMLSLTDIKAAFPGGLIPQHAAWIVRRVMAQTLAANMAGLVHTAITPDHVLVDPIKHEPMHIGWLHAVKDTRVTMIIDRWKDFYPPEVFDKKLPDHGTDIYMAARTAAWLFGGDNKSFPSTIPTPIQKVLLACMNPNPARRPPDGLNVLDDLTKAIRTAWGRSYQPLLLPL